MSTLLNQIQLNYPSLSKLEKRVADYVLKNHQQLLNIHIKSLAIQTDVSIATISRFCHKIGVDSFVEFKILLRDTIQSQYDTDHPLELVNNMYSSVIEASRTLITEEILSEIVTTIDQAKNIYLFGLGSSALTAEEFKLRLNRMGYYVVLEKEAHNMLFTASHLKEGDLVIAFSASGETEEVVDAIKIAQNNQAEIIALTNHNHTTLSTLADQVIYTYSMTNFTEARLLNSQLSFMYVIDVLTLLLMKIEENYQTYTRTIKLLNKQAKKNKPQHMQLGEYL